MPGWLRKLLLSVFLIAIVAGSFWISFLIGKQMLVPARPLPPKVSINVPEANIPNISIEVESNGYSAAPPPKVKIAAKPKIIIPKKKAIEKIETTPKTEQTYQVQAGYFKYEKNANALAEDLKNKGFDAQVSQSGSFYRVTVGNFESTETAQQQIDSLKAAGFDAIIR